MKRTLIPVLALAALAAAAAPALAETPKPVVELFTSQGCSSCPPADAILAKLVEEGDVIALSQHVDYWNYIGWADPFSDAGATERQREYRAQLGTPYVYTPQMVFDGITEAVGSDRRAVEGRIAHARLDKKISLTVEREASKAVVRIPAGAEMAKGATVWQVDYDAAHTTRVRRGENSGATLTNAHVVRLMRRLGSYDGEAMTIPLDLAKLRKAGRGGCAILVQGPRAGRIFGAVAVEVGPGS
jgi:hypothetical protein